MKQQSMYSQLHTFHYNREDSMNLIHNNKNGESCPGNLTKLVFVESLLETQDKNHKDTNVENHRNPTKNQQ